MHSGSNPDIINYFIYYILYIICYILYILYVFAASLPAPDADFGVLRWGTLLGMGRYGLELRAGGQGQKTMTETNGKARNNSLLQLKI